MLGDGGETPCRVIIQVLTETDDCYCVLLNAHDGVAFPGKDYEENCNSGDVMASNVELFLLFLQFYPKGLPVMRFLLELIVECRAFLVISAILSEGAACTVLVMGNNCYE
ncbi:hypothetical protein SDJN02_17302 [Cucurbita argyrosperma subsp. argyrosperma]|nr:hypothetical protein SDJN02_17302 [Cucurbita argyrosperma subsp. argyrosperma]